MAGIDSKTVSLLHFDETIKNIDELNNVWTNVGTPCITEANSKFGSGSFSTQSSTGSGGLRNTTINCMAVFNNDFTIESWFYATVDNATSYRLFSVGFNTAYSTVDRFYAGYGVNTGWNASGVQLNVGVANNEKCVPLSLEKNKWHHYAVCKSGTTVNVFIDGTLMMSMTGTTNFTNIGNAVVLGGRYAYADKQTGLIEPLNGCLDEFRISNVARYTANFTPQTQSFVVDSNTVSLLHFDCAYHVSDENSGNVWTSSGLFSSSADVSMFNRSILFDGGNYLSLQTGNLSSIVDGDFTVDWWEYRTSTTNAPTVFSIGGAAGANVGLAVSFGGGNTVCYATDNSSSWTILNGFNLGSVDLNKWNHFALVRSGNVYYGFKNGVVTSSLTSSLKMSMPSTPSVMIGNWTYSTVRKFSGYLDELRVSKAARWTSSFTPPNLPYSKVRFLAKTTDGHLHSFLNNAWSDLGVPSDSAGTINLFKQSENIDPYDAVTLGKLATTGTPKVCSYQESVSEPRLTSTVVAVPKLQFVYELNNIELKAMSYLDWVHVNDGISNYEAGGGNVRVVVSRDSGKTYVAYNSTTSTWDTIIDTTNVANGELRDNVFVPTDSCLANALQSGMTVTTFNNAPWNAFTLGDGYAVLRLAYVLSIDSSSDSALSDTLKYQYDGMGDWVLAANFTHYKVQTRNNSHTITWLTPIGGMRVKINY